MIANGENAAGGSGITPAIYRELFAAGVDAITLGDHIYRRAEIESVLAQQAEHRQAGQFSRRGAPGASWPIVTPRNGVRVAVLSLLGRVFMRPVDCPFPAADRVLAGLAPDVQVLMRRFSRRGDQRQAIAGPLSRRPRVSAVLGTHTHVPTADEQILPGGTAFQCDVGMTGPYESILGRRIDRVMETTLTFNPTHFEVATGDVRLSGSIVDVDPTTGRASAIRRLVVTAAEAETLAATAPM